MSTPLLEARGLAVAVGGRTLVSHLDFALHAGERLAVLGCNGAGKSTLLATLAGLRRPDAGTLLLAGQTYADLTPRAAALLRGWLGQDHGDPFATTALDVVLAGRHPHLGRWQWEGAADAAIASAALAAAGLAGLEQRNPQSLSAGERQRLAVATLLAQQPKIFLLDEPLAHLDLKHQIAMLELFAALARQQGVASIMVLHDPGLAARYCDRVVLLHGDGAVETGSTGELLDESRLGRLYGLPLNRIEIDGNPVFVPRRSVLELTSL